MRRDVREGEEAVFEDSVPNTELCLHQLLSQHEKKKVRGRQRG